MRTLPTSPKSFRMAPLAAALSAALSLPAAAGLYPVTSTADTLTPGTLRQAITDANANCATDPNPTITFPGSGPFFITLTNSLPSFQCGASTYSPTIDGSSRTGYTANSSTTGWNGNALIQLDGSGVTFGACGLQGFLYGGTMTVIGVRMVSWLYGGTAICGSSLGSKLIVKNSLISGNSNGISLASNSTIGGALADRNVIIANNGVGISGSTATGSIQNNLIGLGADGVTNAGNGKGIQASSTGPVTISGNYVSGNAISGMELSGIGWTVQGNKIGVDTAGNPAGNDGNGITLSVNSGSGSFVTSNVIANNTSAGVAVTSGTGVRISQNSTFANSSGIQLGSGGAVNDTDDLDTGPNLLQNSPGITSVTQSGGSTTVNYDFVSAAGTFILEFFENPTSGLSEGQTYIGSKTVTVPAGTSSSSFVVSGLYSHVSATARESTQGDTSEFWPSVAFIPTPAVTVSPSSVNFGDVPQGGSSLPRTITYTSSGSGTWNPRFITLNSAPSCYGGPVAYGGFMFSTDCNTSTGAYAPGTGCTATVQFAPTVLGPQSAYLCVFDNTSLSGVQSTPLTGNGVVPPTLVLQPATYDFGNVSVRTSSAPARFVLRNPGTIPVDFTTRVSGPFQLGATTCRSPIDPGSTCALTATFTPPAAGPFSDQLAVIPSVGTPAYSQLFGNGVVGPALQLPNSMEFLYAIGDEPALRELRLVNSGTAPLTIDSIRISGTGFTLVNPCPSTLAPDEGCILMLGFSSTTAGQTEGALTVNTNAAGGQQVVQLFGLSQTRPIPLISVTPREMSYGTRSFGTTSPTQTITVRNIGGATAFVNGIVVSPDYVITRNTCTTSLAPLASCEADVAMLPTGYGQRRGVVTVSANDERSPHFVDLLGTSCRTSGLILGRLGITTGCAP